MRLFDQADALLATGQPLQTDLRRAISAAYYGLYHFTLTAAADMVVPSSNRATPRYSLVYRSVDHARLMTLCGQLSRPAASRGTICAVGRRWSGRRLCTDTVRTPRAEKYRGYDPSRDFTIDEAKITVRNAREAVEFFMNGTDAQREAFLTLVLFKPRG